MPSTFIIKSFYKRQETSIPCAQLDHQKRSTSRDLESSFGLDHNLRLVSESLEALDCLRWQAFGMSSAPVHVITETDERMKKKGRLEACRPVFFFRAQPDWIMLGSRQKPIWTLSGGWGGTWASEYSKPANKYPPNCLGIFFLLIESSDKRHGPFLEQQSYQTTLDFHRWERLWSSYFEYRCTSDAIKSHRAFVDPPPLAENSDAIDQGLEKIFKQRHFKGWCHFKSIFLCDFIGCEIVTFKMICYPIKI